MGIQASPEGKAWSWHVARFIGFTEGWLPEVEADPLLLEEGGADSYFEKLKDTGVAAFSYHPVQEFGKKLNIAINQTIEGVAISWVAMGLNFLYTLESSENIRD